MDDDGEELLRAIAADPDSDLPRLVYADHLEERGDADRAEFIRVEVSLARLPGHDPRRPGLRGRRSALRDLHFKEWTAGLPGWVRQPVFVRGLVGDVTCYAGDWLAHGADLLRRYPVQVAYLSRAGRHMKALTASPLLGRLATLDVRFNMLGDENVALLARSPHLSRLRTLHLWTNGVSDAGVAALASSPRLAGLRVLSLGNNDITDAGARLLADSPHLRGLTDLYLYDNHITEAGRDTLRQSLNARVWLEGDDGEPGWPSEEGEPVSG